jgi:hypothetical protein
MINTKHFMYGGISILALAGISAVATIVPTETQAAAQCRPAPGKPGLSVSVGPGGRCPPSYVLVDDENPTAISNQGEIVQTANDCAGDRAEAVWGAGNLLAGYSCSRNANGQ